MRCMARGPAASFLHQGDPLPLYHGQAPEETNPSSIAAKIALGERPCCWHTTLSPEAVSFFEQAARAEPDFRRLQYLLGRAYQLAGRKEEARLAFERSAPHGGTGGKTKRKDKLMGIR